MLDKRPGLMPNALLVERGCISNSEPAYLHLQSSSVDMCDTITDEFGLTFAVLHSSSADSIMHAQS